MSVPFKSRTVSGPSSYGAGDVFVVSETRGAQDAGYYSLNPAEQRALADCLVSQDLPIVTESSGASHDWATVLQLIVTHLLRDAGVQSFAVETAESGSEVLVLGVDANVAKLCAEFAAQAWIGVKQTRLAERKVAHNLLGKIRNQLRYFLSDIQYKSIAEACTEHEVPFHNYEPSLQIIQLGEGRHRQLLKLTDTLSTGLLAAKFAGSKITTNRILARNGIPVPTQIPVHSLDQAWLAAMSLGLPVVVKPVRGNHGNGVSVDVRTRDELQAAIVLAREVYPQVVIESFLRGNDYRVFVANEKVIGIVRRTHPCVTGDGQNSIRELIAIFNRTKPFSDDDLMPIQIGNTDLELLAQNGLTLDSKPKFGELVQLNKYFGRRFGGGCERVVISHAHPDNVDMMIRACRVLSLNPAGIDMRMPDIGQSWRVVGAGICEVNSGSGLRVMLMADQRWVSDCFVPEVIDLKVTRIPHIVILAPVGVSSDADQFCSDLAQELEQKTGWEVARSMCNELWLGKYRVGVSDPEPVKRYTLIIECPTVNAAVYVVSPEQVLLHGLGIKRVTGLIRLGTVDQWSETDRKLAETLEKVAQPLFRFTCSSPCVNAVVEALFKAVPVSSDATVK